MRAPYGFSNIAPVRTQRHKAAVKTSSGHGFDIHSSCSSSSARTNQGMHVCVRARLNGKLLQVFVGKRYVEAVNIEDGKLKAQLFRDGRWPANNGANQYEEQRLAVDCSCMVHAYVCVCMCVCVYV
jgi:hypothetical protein